MKCPDCRGHGSHAGRDLDLCEQRATSTHDAERCPYVHGCLNCHRGEQPCPLHRCPTCQGSGLVCPVCRGDRFVRPLDWNTARAVVRTERCDACCEGNNVSVSKERNAILRYLDRQRLASPAPVKG